MSEMSLREACGRVLDWFERRKIAIDDDVEDALNTMTTACHEGDPLEEAAREVVETHEKIHNEERLGTPYTELHQETLIEYGKTIEKLRRVLENKKS